MHEPTPTPKAIDRHPSSLRAFVELERKQIAFWRYVFVGALAITLTVLTVVPVLSAWISFALAKETLNEKIADSAKLVEANTDNRLIAFRAAIDEAQRQLTQSERAAAELKKDLTERQQETESIRTRFSVLQVTHAEHLARIKSLESSMLRAHSINAIQAISSTHYSDFWATLHSGTSALASLFEKESSYVLATDNKNLNTMVAGESVANWFKVLLSQSTRAACHYSALVSAHALKDATNSKDESMFLFTPNLDTILSLISQLESCVAFAERNDVLKQILREASVKADFLLWTYSHDSKENSFSVVKKQATLIEALRSFTGCVDEASATRVEKIIDRIEAVIAGTP